MPFPITGCRVLLALVFLGVLCYPANAQNDNSPFDPGSTVGSFNVSSHGSATYAIPIACPSGTAGMSPKLAIMYDSQTGPGVMGPGWQLAGYSLIARGPKNFETDGFVQGVNFDSNDALFLDGQRLIPVSKSDAEGYVEYRKEVDDYSRIRAFSFDGKGPRYIDVWTKAGLKMSFGNSEDSRPRRQDGSNWLWLCNRVEDTVGNYVSYHYVVHDDGDYNLARVDYTGNEHAGVTPYASIKFTYERLADIVTTDGRTLPITTAYIGGEKISRTHRLVRIESSFQDQLMRRYEIGYQDFDRRTEPATALNSHCGFRMRYVLESGNDGRQFRPTRFEYSDGLHESSPAWINIPDLRPPANLVTDTGSSLDDLGLLCIDLDGNGMSDILQSSLVDGAFVQRAFLNDGNSWTEVNNYTLPTPLASNGKQSKDVKVIDLNHDGLPDVLSADRDGHGAGFLNGPNRWQLVEGLAPPFPIEPAAQKQGFLLLDIDGDKGRDFVWNGQLADGTISSGARRFTASGWEDFSADFKPPFRVDDEQTFELGFDVNNDGREDLLRFLRDGQRPEVYLSNEAGWQQVDSSSPFVPAIPTPLHPAGIQVIDMNGDGIEEIVAAFTVNSQRVFKIYSPGPGELSEWNSAFELPIPLLTDDGSPTGVRWGQLNADNRIDLLIWTQFGGDTPRESRAAFLQTEAGWESAAKDYLPPLPFLIIRKDRTETVPLALADINGDKVSDLVLPVAYMGNEVASHGRAAWINTGAGWTVSTDFRPPLLVADNSRTDSGVRLIDLNADGMTDLLSSYKAKDKSLESKTFLNSATGWTEETATKWQLAYPTAEEEITDTGIVFVDVNGDARADILVDREPENGQPIKHAFVNHPENGLIDDMVWLPPCPLSKDKFGRYGVRFVDVNGDGLTDVIGAHNNGDGSTTSDVWLNRGNGWARDETYSRFPAVFELAQSRSPSSTKGFPCTISQSERASLEKTIPFRDVSAILADLNGDRLPDIAFNHEVLTISFEDIGGGNSRLSLSKTERKGAFLNTGRGWEVANGYTPPHRLDSDPESRQAYSELQDINGDGLVDLVYLHFDGNTNSSETFLNTGRGWENTATASYKVPDNAFQPKATTDNARGDHGIRFMDLNADGLVDILQSFRSVDGAIANHAWINNGQTWVETPTFCPRIGDQILAIADESGKDTGVRTWDANGDLIVDLLAWSKEDSSEYRAAFLNASQRRDILVAVTNGDDFRVELSYRTMTTGVDLAGHQPNEGNYPGSFYTATKSGTYPILPAPPPVHAIEQVSFFEAGRPLIQSYRYRYGGFKINTRRGDPLGFEWREVNNMSTGMTEYQSFSQDTYLVGTSLHQEVRYNKEFTIPTAAEPRPGILQTKTTHTWNVTTVNDRLDGLQSKRARIYLAQSNSTIFDLNGTEIGFQIDRFEYDGFGNTTLVDNSRSDSSGAIVSSNFDNNDARWLIGRLRNSSHTTFDSDSASAVSTTEFTYDEHTGLLTSESSHPGTSNAVTIRYTYDAFGNRIASHQEVTGAEPRTARTVFDQYGRFPVHSINSLGHITQMEYEPRFGSVVRKADPNGLEERYEYDSHGNANKYTSPAGIVTKSSRSFDTDPFTSEDGTMSAIVTVSQVGDLPPTESIMDCRGRVLRDVSVGESGRTLFRDTVYDAYKRPFKVSDIYIAAEDTAAIVYTTTEYDVTGRPIAISRTGGSRAIFTYSGLVTLEQDQDGRGTTKYYDLQKRLVKLIDPLGSELRYKYDTAGRLCDIQHADGLHSTFEYDKYGNKTGSFDPNAGSWQYEYNAFGELIAQINPLSQRTTLEYDVLGRIVRKTQPDESIVWTYDLSQHGIGRPHAVETSGGYSEAFQYDHFGRVSFTHITVNAQRFTSSTSYDDLGRIKELSYPTGFRVEHVYDSWGFLRAIRSPDSLHEYWRGLKYDEFGQVVEERFGNGATSHRRFDSVFGRMASVQVNDPRETPILGEQYAYDSRGNITSRHDTISGCKEEFEYDLLDRLTAWQVNGTREEELCYDVAGRVLEKTSVGRFNYSKPETGLPAHAVTSISKHDGTLAVYDYDSNGRIASSPTNCRFTYTSSNQTASVTSRTGAYSCFKYTPKGQRYYHLYRDGLTEIASLSLGLYECSWEGFGASRFCTSLTKRHKHYVVAPSGVCAIVEDVNESSSVAANRLSRKPVRSGYSCAKYLTFYVHSDVVGTVAAITDIAGRIVRRNVFDPWGKPIAARYDTELANQKKGFTGHESLDHLGLVHMQGRLYDPQLGMFTQSDSVAQSAFSACGLNLFAYAMNNPLKYVDPSGHFIPILAAILFGGLILHATGALDWIYQNVLKPVGKWIADNWKAIVVTAAAIIVSVVTFGAAAPAAASLTGTFLAGVAAGAASGFVAGGLSVALNGGSIGDILQGAVLGAAIGALTGAMMAGSNLVTGDLGWIGKPVAYGVSGGISDGLQGRSFFAGFLSGMVGNLIGTYIRGFRGDGTLRVFSTAIVGGTVAEIGGGKFANGAMTASFSYMLSGGGVSGKSGSAGGVLGKVLDVVDSVLGKIWAAPYTALGLAYGLTGHVVGLIAGTNPDIRIIDNAIRFFNNPFVPSGAGVALGNVVVFGDASAIVDKSEAYLPGSRLGPHEGAHTYQAELLGPFYGPVMLPTFFMGGKHPFEAAADQYSLPGGNGGWLPR